jgi:aerobic carbon-monoxide dehydrogenase medium subunit
MYELYYHKPTSLDDVANLLSANEEAKIVAGGMTLIPTLKQRLARPSDLIDLTAIAGPVSCVSGPNRSLTTQTQSRFAEA